MSVCALWSVVEWSRNRCKKNMELLVDDGLAKGEELAMSAYLNLQTKPPSGISSPLEQDLSLGHRLVFTATSMPSAYLAASRPGLHSITVRDQVTR